MSVSYKKCRICNISKEASLEFFQAKFDNADGYERRCKLCLSDIRKKILRENKEVFCNRKTGLDPRFINNYIIFKCEVCENNFYPHNSAHKLCLECSLLSRRIRNSLCQGRTYLKQNKRTGITAQEIVKICKRYLSAQECVYCKRFFSKENPKNLDHIIPVRTIHINTSDNINICCKECNNSKNGLPLNEWIDLCRRVVQNADKKLIT